MSQTLLMVDQSRRNRIPTYGTDRNQHFIVVLPFLSEEQRISLKLPPTHQGPSIKLPRSSSSIQKSFVGMDGRAVNTCHCDFSCLFSKLHGQEEYAIFLTNPSFFLPIISPLYLQPDLRSILGF